MAALVGLDTIVPVLIGIGCVLVILQPLSPPDSRSGARLGWMADRCMARLRCGWP